MAVGGEQLRFAELDVRGDARARGQAHGEHFSARIAETFSFYMDSLFAGGPLGPQQIADRAQQIPALVSRYAPMMSDQIEGIAQGCGLPAWKIYVLNARTEILNARIDECSALFFTDTGVLAQNWDWVEPLEALCVLIHHGCEDGHSYLAFGEPGMVGKIGLNSAGLGVCLNILFAPHNLTGLPVHILIGALLNCRSYSQAEQLLANCGLGKASHLLLASANGDAVSMEYFGDERHALLPENGVLMHTNHCLGRGAAGRTSDLANSCARYDRMVSAVAAAKNRDLGDAKAILLSEEGGEDALMRAYKPQSVLGDHLVGTCACIVMELGPRRMHIRRGPGPADDFLNVSLDRSSNSGRKAS